ncbi:MAG TPA: toll/interleukin-1 receptor domain-containing protein [Thermoanaerobaculia bacterium]|nr:toll/interleukin-1 receptor domain-containing protein [Thermoanaerobaculia bacterium]
MNEPKVFISYSRDDAEWARRFAEALRKQSVEVWLDTWQIHAGEPLRDAIEAGLRGSDAIVSILSESNAQRPNVLFELGVALGAGKLLIPIIPADLEGSSVPFGLRSRRYLTKGAPDEAAREVAEALKSKAA